MYQTQRRKGIMLCYPFEEKRLQKWNTQVLIQPKLDGERCRAVHTSDGYILLSSEENEITSCPHINSALNSLGTICEFDGELYLHGMKFEDIHSVVSRKVNFLESDFMQYHIFDIIEEDTPQLWRSQDLINIGQKFTHPLQRVTTTVGWTLDHIMEWYDKFLKLDYEGMILRHPDAPYVRKRSPYVMKFKPKQSDFYLITGWNEEVSIKGEPKERLGSLEVCDPEGNFFCVGTGLSSDDREALWLKREGLRGKLCEIKYQHRTERGVPRFPVFARVVEE